MKNQEIRGSFTHGLLFYNKMGGISVFSRLFKVDKNLSKSLPCSLLASIHFEQVFLQSCYTFTVFQIRIISNNLS